MTTEQSRELELFVTTQKIIDNYQSIWAQQSGFAEAVSDFKETLEAIQDFLKLGKTCVQKKPVIEKKLIERAVRIGSIIYNYAEEGNLQALKNSMNYSVTDLFKDETIIAFRCKVILEKATSLFAGLKPFGISVQELYDFEDILNQYTLIIHGKSPVLNDNSYSKEAISGLFEKAYNILNNRIDSLMSDYKQAHPKFFISYLRSRLMLTLPSENSNANTKNHSVSSKHPVPNVEIFLNYRSLVESGKAMGIYSDN